MWFKALSRAPLKAVFVQLHSEATMMESCQWRSQRRKWITSWLLAKGRHSKLRAAERNLDTRFPSWKGLLPCSGWKVWRVTSWAEFFLSAASPHVLLTQLQQLVHTYLSEFNGQMSLNSSIFSICWTTGSSSMFVLKQAVKICCGLLAFS